MSTLRAEVAQALNGDSNDAEHDALVSCAEAIGLEQDDEGAWREPPKERNITMKQGRPNGCILAAAEFIREELARGPCLATTMYNLAAVQGISSRTLRRAAETVGVQKDGAGPATHWRLEVVA